MTTSANRKKKRWRRLVIGGIASIALVWGGYQLSQVGGRDSAVSHGQQETGDASKIGPAYRWGQLDATAIQSMDGTP